MEALIVYAQLSDLGITYTRFHLSRLEKAGRFPRRIELQPGGRVAWRASEVSSWIEERQAPTSPRIQTRKLKRQTPSDKLTCVACGVLFERTRGRPPRRCPECREAGQ